jgi:hypothetical protein
MDNLMDWLLNWLLGSVPAWVWIVLAGVALGWAWKVFGWQGVVGGLLAVLTLGAYRQGWRDSRGGNRNGSPIGKRHPVNRNDVVVGVEPPPQKKRRPF